MRLRTFVRWVVGLLVLAWLGYSAVTASSSYFATQSMVDQVLQEAASRVKAGAASGSQPQLDDLVADVRTDVVLRARRYGLLLDERSVNVLPAAGGLTVRLKWSHPAIAYRGDPILVIPMSLERSLPTP
ncbi:MAG: hypothetical protein HYV93_24590 [Candidatus Rokubacteria bacterium]|nr:hypothetical protein [Candidatus Rokubacteria bacterium]